MLENHIAKKYLIVTADDFGLRSHINNGIIKAACEGIVRNVSLMANGEAFNEAVKLLEITSKISAGVHLSLVGGSPVLPQSEVGSIVQKNGSFFPDFIAFIKYYLQGKFNATEIFNELEAQIIRIKEAGISITHIDSHQHIHCLPGLFDHIQSLAYKHNIRYIRIPREPFMFRSLMRRPIRALKQQILAILACSNRRKHLSLLFSTDHFRGFLYGGCLTKERLMEILSNLKNGVTELMCHPGYKSDEGHPAAKNYFWETELKALTDPEVIEFINKKKIVLSDFSSISSMQNVFDAV